LREDVNLPNISEYSEYSEYFWKISNSYKNYRIRIKIIEEKNFHLGFDAFLYKINESGKKSVAVSHEQRY